MSELRVQDHYAGAGIAKRILGTSTRRRILSRCSPRSRENKYSTSAAASAVRRGGSPLDATAW
jgi:hypothetical protein